MFRHILLPTDGSAASENAIEQSIRFAGEIGAKVTGIYVIPKFHVITTQTGMLEDTREQYEKDSEEYAKKYLAVIETAAREARIPCETMYVSSDHPYEEIIKAAEDGQCDLIAMASHGRRGMQGLLLGSETQKVLTHCRTPVLVYR